MNNKIMRALSTPIMRDIQTSIKTSAINVVGALVVAGVIHVVGKGIGIAADAVINAATKPE